MKDTKGLIKVHNARFYNLFPRSIERLAYNCFNGKIAVLRSDSSIEIWDIAYAPILEKTIGCQTNITNSSIEGIAWFGERLFSGDLSGQIIEYDLITLTPKRQQFVTGNSIWCIDVHKRNGILAAGTEEGYLNIFDLKDNNLMYKTVFDKQDGRILCCRFSPNGDYIVTGSLDVIRIWSTSTGNAIRKISTGRTEKKKQTKVWSLQVLKDLTIVSGDSRGILTVWDGNNGAQIESHQVFERDILCLEVNEEQSVLMCAGVEALIRIYFLTPITKNNQTIKRWVKFLQRRVHDHDVKALAFAGLKIISGGVDGFLGFSSYSKVYQEIKKYGPFVQNPCISVAKNVRQLLLRYPNSLEIWRLGESDKNTAEKLLEMKSKNANYIVCSAISIDGKWLVYSTTSTIRLFHLTNKDNVFGMAKVNVKSDKFSPSIRVVFGKNSNDLYIFKADRTVNIFKINETEISFCDSIDLSKQLEELPVITLLSDDESILALAAPCKTVCIYRKHAHKWKHYVNLPKYSCPITALNLHPSAPKLIAVYSNGMLYEYDLLEKQFINTKSLPDSDFTMDCVKNVLVSNNNDDKILLQTENNLLSAQWQTDVDEEPSKKKHNGDVAQNTLLQINYARPYDNLIETSWLSAEEVVIVGVNPVSLIEVLPGAFRRKVFGAS